MKEVNIGLSSDNNYAQHMGVTIFSIISNCSSPQNLNFYIIDCGISETNKSLISKICSDNKVKIRFISPPKERIFDELKLGSHLTVATYYKLLFPKLLPKLKKIIYLDSDIIVEGDVQELWDIDLKNNIIGAVPDGDIDTKNICKRNLEISDSEDYFNSGVMIMNSELWRKNKIETKIVKFIKENPEKIYIQEQDGLNFVLRNKWLKLPFEWNAIHTFFYNSIKLKKLLGIKRFNQIKNNPKIIHYTIKPWKFEKVHPRRNRYWYYLRKTPWKNYRYPDKNFKNLIKKSFKMAIRPIPWEFKIKLKNILIK